MFFELGSAPFLNVFDDLRINLLEEIIGLSQYPVDVLVFESLLHDVAFLPDYQLSFHENIGIRGSTVIVCLSSTTVASKIHLHLQPCSPQSRSFFIHLVVSHGRIFRPKHVATGGGGYRFALARNYHNWVLTKDLHQSSDISPSESKNMYFSHILR